MATEAERAALRQRIANLLMGNVVQRIGFTIAGHDISPGGFMVIAMSLATAESPGMPGHRPHTMSVQISTDLPPHAGAAYHAWSNAIQVPRANYGTTHRDRVTLVHEAVHAIFDYQRIRLGAMREEAAAYIADAMYESMLGFPTGGGTRMEQTARSIADALLAGSPGRAGARPTVTQEQLTQLTGHIHAHPAYNGIARGFMYDHTGGRI